MLCVMMALTVGALSPEQQLQAAEPADSVQTPLKVGDTAPDFTLKWFDGADMKDVSLHDYKGKRNVLLAFYVFAFTGG
jgi:peroxiredoxin